MDSCRWVFFVAVGVCLLANVRAWGTDEMELFDLVEDVNKNFYELLGVSKDADNKEIKKAFRKLSLVLHPDKNDAPDADVQFRQLVGVYEVLSDAQKRQRYHDVLEFGLPDWKSAVYYYRRVRKMGLLEMAVILFMILTVGQYIVLWAAYAEKKYTIEQNINARNKKAQKKVKKSVATEEELDFLEYGLEKPSVLHLLPFQTVKIAYLMVTGAPQLYSLAKELWEERKRQKLEEEELANMESSEDEEPREKKPRRRKTFLPPEVTYDDEENLMGSDSEGSAKETKVSRPAPIVGGLWTDDDFAELVRLVKKFPGGSPNRWETIAESMNRTVPEVTHMAKRVLEDLSRNAASPEEEQAPEEEVVPKKVKTKGGKLGNAEEGTNAEANKWSQPQQKALENALIKFPKGTSERWVKIAKCVPGKSMEECMLRFKHLAELIRKKKQAQEEVEQETPEDKPQENVSVTESVQ